MNSCRFQQYAEMNRTSIFSDLVVCPKPFDRSPSCQVSHQLELSESNSENEVLDLIISKGGGCEQDPVKTVTSSSSPPLFFTGSPPSRVSNPLTRDSLFQTLLLAPPATPRATKPYLPPSPRNGGGGCVRVTNPPVRVVGFDCPDMDRHSSNRSISTLA